MIKQIALFLIFFTISFSGGIIMAQNSNKIDLDSIYSSKQLGAFAEGDKTYFRIFAPTAEKVFLYISDKADFKQGKYLPLTKDSNGVWETALDKINTKIFYGFKVVHSAKDDFEKLPIVIDPYSKAVATYNTYLNPRLSVYIPNNSFDWEGDKSIRRNWKDLVIYEMHVRDLTADSSSGAEHPGTYLGLTEPNIAGGLSYIKSLGVNAVELLPTQEFANIELPYNKELNGIKNTWNPYERNHWGYMTAAFFAPEAYYSEDVKELEWNKWSGTDGKQINDFKKMVKSFHQNGISVIMDVVYNHLSEYEIGNLKQIDKDYYFRLDKKGNFISQSYCGNDLKTERPMLRRLIIDSILYWMKEYHVDGFRFDLAKLLDWETIEDIIREAKKVNPEVVIIAEPWGGGYDLKGFSARGWAAWNDQIRNGVKGQNPFDGLGWIFGKMYGNNSIDRIKSYVRGTLLRDENGVFTRAEHSVNYFESHDDYTLGDFIRIGLGRVKQGEKISDLDANAKLSPDEIKLNKLAALFLFTSRGIAMIGEGQEFGRSKVIDPDSPVKDEHKGEIDHNSYNKDNRTNYINYDYAKLNSELADYYKGLISVRNKYAAFRRAKYEDVSFIDVGENQFLLEYTIKFEDDEFFVVMNADRKNQVSIDLPEGNWGVLVSPNSASAISTDKVCNKLDVPASSGFILIKE
jgi:pullulanase